MANVPTKFNSKKEAQAKIDELVECRWARGGRVMTDNVGGYYAEVEMYMNGGLMLWGDRPITRA
jgi:hypothetical protein